MDILLRTRHGSRLRRRIRTDGRVRRPGVRPGRGRRPSVSSVGTSTSRSRSRASSASGPDRVGRQSTTPSSTPRAKRSRRTSRRTGTIPSDTSRSCRSTVAWCLSTPNVPEIDRQKPEVKALRDSRPDLVDAQRRPAPRPRTHHAAVPPGHVLAGRVGSARQFDRERNPADAHHRRSDCDLRS